MHVDGWLIQHKTQPSDHFPNLKANFQPSLSASNDAAWLRQQLLAAATGTSSGRSITAGHCFEVPALRPGWQPQSCHAGEAVPAARLLW